MVSLAIAISVTRNLRVGTGISLVVQHDPIVLAKSISTLDHLSNGRFELGIGGGWLKEEMENHGFPFSKRWKLLRERIEAVKEIWDNAQATYSGEFVNFENIISNLHKEYFLGFVYLSHFGEIKFLILQALLPNQGNRS